MDNEELIRIVLRGLPKDFAHFCSAIRTRSEPITYEQLSIMLQSEEQAMAENLDSFSHSLAMFASGNKGSISSHLQPHNHGGFNGGSNRGGGRNNGNRGRGKGRFNNSHGGGQHQFFNSQPQQNYNSPQNAHFGGNLVVNLVVRPSRMIDLAVRFVARQVTKLLTVITEWILSIKARIHQPN